MAVTSNPIYVEKIGEAEFPEPEFQTTNGQMSIAQVKFGRTLHAPKIRG
jgi:hypothetical protein